MKRQFQLLLSLRPSEELTIQEVLPRDLIKIKVNDLEQQQNEYDIRR